MYIVVFSLSCVSVLKKFTKCSHFTLPHPISFKEKQLDIGFCVENKYSIQVNEQTNSKWNASHNKEIVKQSKRLFSTNEFLCIVYFSSSSVTIHWHFNKKRMKGIQREDQKIGRKKGRTRTKCNTVNTVNGIRLESVISLGWTLKKIENEINTNFWHSNFYRNKFNICIWIDAYGLKSPPGCLIYKTFIVRDTHMSVHTAIPLFVRSPVRFQPFLSKQFAIFGRHFESLSSANVCLYFSPPCLSFALSFLKSSVLHIQIHIQTRS